MSAAPASIAERLLAAVRAAGRVATGALPDETDIGVALCELRDETRLIRLTLEAIAVTYARANGIVNLEETQRPLPGTPQAALEDAADRVESLALLNQSDVDYKVEEAAEDYRRKNQGREMDPAELALIRTRLGQDFGGLGDRFV